MRRVLTGIVLTAGFAAAAGADTVTVAVASNFAELAHEIATAFESRGEHQVTIVAGSSGRLFAQIVNGAPYDVFLSADAARPAALAERELAVAGTRRTYAIGQLVIWSRHPNLEKPDCRSFLDDPGNARIAVANPLLAPYGVATKEYLDSENLWERIRQNLVIAENIAQTLQFAESGGAALGFIAKSQLGRVAGTTCVYPVPPGSHQPIEQQLVMLIRARKNEAAIAFLDYLHGADAQARIRRSGYLTEGDGQ